MRTIITLCCLSLVTVFTGSCQTPAGQSITRSAANLVLPPDQEEQLGEQMAAEIRREMRLIEGTELSSYVSRLGRKVVRVADAPQGIDFEFHVVDDDEQVNAFAIPGGHIYVTTGLLKAADNEAELMAVLSHEVAHVTQRHIAESLATQYGISMLGSLALGQNPSQLAQLVAGVAAQGYLLKYSRDDEREADEVGMRYLVQTGYSPYGYVTFFEELAGQSQPPAFLSSHPHPEERVTNARQMIATYRRNVMEQPTYEDRYEQMTATL